MSIPIVTGWRITSSSMRTGRRRVSGSSKTLRCSPTWAGSEHCCGSRSETAQERAMSRQNKVNKNHYDQAGRLTPDEMARERMKQGQMTGHAKGKENVIGKVRSPS